MQNDPFAPKYGGGQGPQAQNSQIPQPAMYGGVPVGQPKKGLNPLLIPLILAVVFLLSAIGFGIWAFMGMQDYKTNVQPKIDSAVAIAEEQTATAKDKEFIEKEKQPTKQYKSPQVSGSISFSYPKTWSGYVAEEDKGSELVDGYFHPNIVPGVDSEVDFALRVRVLSSSYEQELKKYESKAKSGKLTIAAYKAPKMAEGTLGVRIEGEVNPGQQDSMVLFPLRDKTIEISTESAQFLNDFNTIILASLVYAP